MGKLPAVAVWRGPTPENASLVGVLLLGLAAVLFLPALAPHVPHLGTAAQARWAVSGTGVLVVLVVFAVAVGRRHALSLSWVACTSLYVTGLVIVKFVLSPSAYSRSHGKSLTAFIVAGLVVSLLYIAALVAMDAAATRRGETWSVASKLALAIALGAAAVAARVAAAAVLGTTSGYFHDLSHGRALIMPGLVIIASVAIMQSYQLAGSHRREAFTFSVVVVVLSHVFWVVYMYRLF